MGFRAAVVVADLDAAKKCKSVVRSDDPPPPTFT